MVFSVDKMKICIWSLSKSHEGGEYSAYYTSIFNIIHKL